MSDAETFLEGQPAPAGRFRRLLRGTWRWTKRIAIAVGVLLVVGRLTMPLWLGPAANAAAKGAGLHVSWADMDLSLLGLSVDVNGLRVVPLRDENGAERDAEALRSAEPFALLDDLGADLDVSALLTGTLRAHRVEVGGLEAWLSRDAAGVWNFETFAPAGDDLEEPTKQDPEAPAPKADSSDPAEDAAIDFSSPIEIASVAVGGVRLHVRDDAVAPVLDTTLELDALLRDVGHQGRPMGLRVVARAPELLDVMTIEGTVTGREATLTVDLDGRIDGVGLARMAPYLEPAGLRPAASNLDARFSLNADLRPVPGTGEDTPLALTGSATFGGLAVTADGEPALELAGTTLTLERATTRFLHVASARLEGLSAHARRLPDGVLRVAGLDLVGAPPSEEEPEEEPPAPDPEDTGEAGSGSALRIDLVEIAGLEATFDDAAVQPAAALALAVDGTVKDVVIGSDDPTPMAIDLGARVRDAAAFSVKGTATLGTSSVLASLQLGADELTLAALAPYLDGAGLESTFQQGSLGVGIEFEMQSPGPEDEDGAPTRMQARLEGLRLADGESSFLELGSVALEGFESSPTGETRIAALSLGGARAPVNLFPGGGFSGFGLRSKGLPEDAVPRTVGLGGGDLTVRDVAFGGAASTATIDGAIELLGVADAVTLDATIETRPGPLDVKARVAIDGSGVRYEGLEDILRGAGIEPLLEDGTLRLRASAEARDIDGALHASALIEDLALAGPAGELVSLDRVALESLVAAESEVTIEAIELSGGALPVLRREDGVLEVFGLAIGGAEPAAVAGSPAADQAAAGTGPAAGARAEEAGTEPASSDDAATGGSRFALERLSVGDLAVQWRDEAVAPAVATRLTASVTANSVELIGSELSPVTAEVALSVEGALDALTVGITASSGAAGSQAEATLALTGFRPGPLTPYLPPNLPVLYDDGRFRAHLVASATPHAEGGQTIAATIDGVDLRNGEGGEPLLAFDRAVVDAPRIDGEGGVFDVAEVSVAGFAFEVERVSETRIEALGVAFDSALQPDEPAADEPAEEPAAPPETADAPEDAPRVAKAPAQPEKPPTVTLGKLDLGIERLRYVDRTTPGAEPLDLALALQTPGAQTLLAPDPEDLPPAILEVVGSLSPLAREIRMTLEAEPFAGDPGAKITARIAGIDGAALGRVDPRLVESLDPSGFVDGVVELGADVRLAAARRGPMDFDLSRGFGATLAVAPVHVRPTPDADPTGIDRFDVEVKRINPGTGDVRIASVDLAGIHARVEKREDGTHIAGLRLPPPPTPPEGEEAAAEAPSPEDPPPAEDASADVADAEEPTPAAGGEVAIDQLTVSGLDFAFEDHTVTPALLLPIADAQLEVSRFTTRTLTEKRPFSFRMVVDSGEVPLPERTGEDNLLAGVLGSVASMATGGDDSFEIEERRVWDLFEVSGRLSLGPAPRGRVETQLLGLELPAFRGPAAAGGVEIGDGLVDSRVKLRFREDGGLGINSKTVTNYLSLSEPPDGPITKYLQLPAPLDTVLFLLRNEDGAQELPVRLDIAEDGVGGGQIAALAAQTLGLLITDAVSSAPLRVLGPLTDVAGALGLGGMSVTAETVSMVFESGSATLATAEFVAAAEAEGAAPVGLEQLANALRKDSEQRVVIQATLGAGDLETARRIANPPRAVLDELIAARRARKAAIERERAVVAARAKAQLAAGSTDLVAESSERLRALESQRRDTEQALDALLARIRPGAERRADMRTRNAAIALGKERMARVRARLIELAGPAAGRRIDVRRPRYVEPKEDRPLPERGTVTLTPRQ